MKNQVFLSIILLLNYLPAVAQDIQIHFSPEQFAIRQFEMMGVHDDILYVRAMGANLHTFDAKTGAKIGTGSIVDKKSKGKYLTADQLQVIMTNDGFYTLYFKKAGGNYKMMMGKYDFHEQPIIPDKEIDGELANTSYYSIEETFVHLEYSNGKVYVCFNNLKGNDKTICAYVLDSELNLLGSAKILVSEDKKNQSYEKVVITDAGEMWLIRDLTKYDKSSIFFFDNAYSRIHSGIDRIEFYRFYMNGSVLKSNNFRYTGSPNYHSVNLHSYANNLVMGNSHAGKSGGEKGYYVWLNGENQSSEKEVEFTYTQETKAMVDADDLDEYYMLAGVTKSGNNIFSVNGTTSSKNFGFIEEVALDGSRRIFKSTYRNYGYDNSNSYVHVNKEGNYILCLTYRKGSLEAIKVDLTTGKETVVDFTNLVNIPYLSCKIANSGNYYTGYWFTDNLATTGGVFVVEVK